MGEGFCKRNPGSSIISIIDDPGSDSTSKMGIV
jgi:hypothetical protein